MCLYITCAFYVHITCVYMYMLFMVWGNRRCKNLTWQDIDQKYLHFGLELTYGAENRSKLHCAT